MGASDFEFRHRFLIIAGLFWVAFCCYWVDPVNAGLALARALARGGDVDGAYRAVAIFSAALVATTAALRTWCTAWLSSDIVHAPAVQTGGLVATGPYRHVRNPIYLGNFPLAVGIGLMASRLGFVVLLVGITLFTWRLIFREEAGLLAAQGESYRAFCAAVPRLLPALRPRIPASGARPRWGQAWVGEAWMWGFALASATYAATLDLRLYGGVMAGCMVAYGALIAWQRR